MQLPHVQPLHLQRMLLEKFQHQIVLLISPPDPIVDECQSQSETQLGHAAETLFEMFFSFGVLFEGAQSN